MTKLVLLLAGIFLFNGCLVPEDVAEQERRERNGINLLLFQSEEGAYSGCDFLWPIYNYEYNDQRRTEELVILPLLPLLPLLYLETKEPFHEDKQAVLGLLYAYEKENFILSGRSSGLFGWGSNRLSTERTWIGPGGVLWTSQEGVVGRPRKGVSGYRLPEKSTETWDAIAWGLLWAHSTSAEEDVKQVTPFFKYVKDLENQKKIFRLFWFINIPIGDLASEDPKDEDEGKKK